MPSQLLKVSQALFVKSPQWHVLLLMVIPLAVQCLPAQNQIQMMRHNLLIFVISCLVHLYEYSIHER